MEAFDEDSTFGCNRRWWFDSVAKIPRGPDEKQFNEGTRLHKQIEENLLNGIFPDETHLLFWSGAHLYTPVARRMLGVETPFLFSRGGHSWSGKIDVWGADFIWDWKTTKDWKYASKEGSLPHDSQMLVYQMALTDQQNDEIQIAKVFFKKLNLPEHVEEYLQNLRAAESWEDTTWDALGELAKEYAEKPRIVETTVTKDTLEERFARLDVVAKIMSETAKETEPTNVRPDRRKCRFCPYRKTVCPPDA